MSAPLARPGYVLRYDMVFVPRQPLRWDLFASGDALPRAVPQDAVVSLLNLAVPGWLLQRIALVAIIWFAVVGAGRLVPARRELTRLVAAIGYAWTPFMAERLLLGQWGLLLAYAALPWLVRAAIGLREGRRGALPRVIVAAAAAAITPTGGLLALTTVSVLLLGHGGPARRAFGTAFGAVAVLNLPWLVAAATTAAGGRSDPDGVAAFAARAENWGGPLVALAGTGGIWNSLTTPASRGALLVPVVTVGLLVLAALGFPVLRDRWPAGAAARLGVLAVGSFAVASLAALPGGAAALRWLVAEVPGAGLLRDGQKLLVPYALCLVLCAALGGERTAGRLRHPGDRLALVGLVLLPVAVLPDLAYGVAGRLQPARYPQEWGVVARAVAREPGPTLSLPMSMYRSYRWNHGTVVIDPLARYLPVEVITDDTLIVGGRSVAGESDRVARIRGTLAEGRSLAGSDLRWVVVQHRSGGTVPPQALEGLQVVHDGAELTLYRNPTAPQTGTERHGGWPLILGLCSALALLLLAILSLLRRPTAW
ncbi:LPXTG-motif cell wall anchor domain-containing protein [Micromonospora coriariae]|uniref:LPXTG-motif cell wall anchor domain-containing protein n=1 Tax=Micromonospora coriariae TaxID=285665 RepID=A0A1C4VX17_9ACTN|nr:LPXTG-motif cell wall anchor domain-containing protein [Micromonospora coriariae]